jgi:thiol-disulfide isomerase/thioredoxin
MRRRWASLFVGACVVLAGCRSGEKRAGDEPRPFVAPTSASPDRLGSPERPAEVTARPAPRPQDSAANPDSPAHWLDKAKPDWMKGATPTAPSWNTPTDPGYNFKSETSGLLAGYVEDPDGRKMKKVYIAVREVGDTNPKDVGVFSDGVGSFLIQGLKANRNYQLSVNAVDGDRKLFGVVYTKTPNPNVRIPLLEGELSGLPAARSAPADPKPPAGNLPADDPLKRSGQPPTNSLPVPSLESPRSHNGAQGGHPPPRPLDADNTVHPTGGYDVPTPAGPTPDRYDLMTDQGPLPWKPPAAAIPSPRTASPIPPPDRPRTESRKESFAFVDATGRGVNLPKSKLVVVTFVTTGSPSCQRAVAGLNGVHEKYVGRGVEVVGLVCDDEPLKTRVMAADRFRTDHRVGFGLLTEPGKRPDEWLRRYGIAEVPTAVLLDSDGGVLWQGNPADTTSLTTAIEDHLR